MDLLSLIVLWPWPTRPAAAGKPAESERQTDGARHGCDTDSAGSASSGRPAERD